MDYKKEYEAMVQRARELHKGGNALTKQQMEIVYPELAESEDKRVNEEIRNFLIDMECKREWIAYLEKRKEPDYCHHEVGLSGCSEEYSKGYYDGWNNCNQQHSQLEAEQKPAEWSEEDERIRGHIIDVLTYYAENHNSITEAFIKRDINWFKSLPMGCPKKEEKEIDLDGEITKYWKDISSLYGPVGKEITRFDFEDVCKYFYELGKNARKEK